MKKKNKIKAVEASEQKAKHVNNVRGGLRPAGESKKQNQEQGKTQISQGSLPTGGNEKRMRESFLYKYTLRIGPPPGGPDRRRITVPHR